MSDMDYQIVSKKIDNFTEKMKDFALSVRNLQNNMYLSIIENIRTWLPSPISTKLFQLNNLGTSSQLD